MVIKEYNFGTSDIAAVGATGNDVRATFFTIIFHNSFFPFSIASFSQRINTLTLLEPQCGHFGFFLPLCQYKWLAPNDIWMAFDISCCIY